MLAAFNYYVFLGYRNIFVFFTVGSTREPRRPTTDERHAPTAHWHCPQPTHRGLGFRSGPRRGLQTDGGARPAAR